MHSAYVALVTCRITRQFLFRLDCDNDRRADVPRCLAGTSCRATEIRPGILRELGPGAVAAGMADFVGPGDVWTTLPPRIPIDGAVKLVATEGRLVFGGLPWAI